MTRETTVQRSTKASLERVLGLALVLVASFGAPVAAQSAASDWTFDLALYGWASGMSGKAGARGVSVEVDVSFSDVVENLEMAGMAGFAATNGRWVVLGDTFFATTLALDGMGSSDPEESSLTYFWTTDCPPFNPPLYDRTFDDATSPQPSLTASSSDSCSIACNVSLIVTDDQRFRSTRDSATVTIEDTTPPTLDNVPTDETIQCGAIRPPPARDVSATDTCDTIVVPTFAETRIDGSCAANYTRKRTWTAVDDCGNSTSDSQTITVKDTHKPNIFCHTPWTMTPSPQHTAVKIAPEYSGPVVHVLDASRAVGVVASLLGTRRRVTFDAENRQSQARLREQHARRQERPLLSFEAARANRLVLAWHADELARPSFVGRRVIDDVPLETLVPFIDWTFFFTAWELKGRVPQIFDHPQYGAAARELYDSARRLLDDIINDHALRAAAVYGFWPAESDGDRKSYK